MINKRSSLQWWSDELVSLRDKHLPEEEYTKCKKILFNEYKKRHKEEQREIYESGKIEHFHTYESNFEEYYQKYFGVFVDKE